MRQAWIGLLLVLALPLPLLARSHDALAACRALREQRDVVASKAMQAEIALLQELRLRLCPQQEVLADEAHADNPAVQAEVDYGAYIQCRRQAEQQLQRSRVVLHRNLQGFSFYTVEGARLARQADALQEQSRGACERRSTP